MQAKTGATVDGVYGPQTRERMLWRVHPKNIVRFSCATF
jgi:hypothetical protein